MPQDTASARAGHHVFSGMRLSDEHYRRLERMYSSAAINTYYAPTLTVSHERADVRIAVRPDFFHAAHAIHGSVYFKALDDAAFFASQSIEASVFMLTVSFNIVLLRPVTEGAIIAQGRLVHASKQLIVAEAELTDERGKALARGNGTFMRSKTELDERVGYRSE
jgi:uncharacterized protein (TIGR00369 family)